MRYLITKKCDGSIVDFGHLSDSGDAPPDYAVELLSRVNVTAVTVDYANGTRIRFEE